jgi:D-alanyl-D-alanine carboxypeptidase/D-alanyl-D-alanine-endopeptidase (penicillin-binding protein 4)
VLAVGVTASCSKAPLVVPVAAVHPVPATIARIGYEIRALLKRPGHLHASWGIAVRSLRTGEALFEHNARALLVPGSTLKVVTVAAAAGAVGWDYAFSTTVETVGAVEASTLTGDLVIRGNGDPSMMGRAGTDLMAPLVTALRQRGITHITGRVIGDDNAVEEPRPGLAWSWDDLGTASGALSGALNATENVTRVVVRPGNAPGLPTSLEPPLDDPEMVITNQSTTTAAGTPRALWAERYPGHAGLIVAGTLAEDTGPAVLTVSVGNPTQWVARLVRSRLASSGITVEGQAIDADDLSQPLPPGDALLTLRSRRLSDMVIPMLKDSVNVYADAVLRLATGREGPREIGAALAAERISLRKWRITEEAAVVVDGSGLSRFNLFSATGLVTVLTHEWDPAGRSPLMQALPVAGVDGTLARRMKGTAAAGNLRAKTGSMTHVRSLAGYVTSGDGEPLAFAIIANNYEGPALAVTASIDAIATVLAGFRR